MKLFDQPVDQLIRQRTSWRSYQPRPLDPNAQEALQTFLEQQATGPLGARMRFTLVAASGDHRDELRGLGTYGFIRNPAGFVVGAAEPSAVSLEDFGFVMERMILRATDLGLGSCWLGGSFKRSSFAARIEAREDEQVPAVFSVGHPGGKRGALDRMVRWGAGSRRRRPWGELFFHGTLHSALSAEQAGPHAGALEMLRLAPSASNRQPWRVLKEPDRETFHFLLRRERKYNRNLRMLKLADLPRVDLGIAMCHFELSSREAGLEGGWDILPESLELELPEGTQYVATWQTNT